MERRHRGKGASVKYVAVDIGCIECGASSDVIGVFDTRQAAEDACKPWEALGWIGEQHYYEVFDVAEENVAKEPGQ